MGATPSAPVAPNTASSTSSGAAALLGHALLQVSPKLEKLLGILAHHFFAWVQGFWLDTMTAAAGITGPYPT
jgi:hypothetical protein